MLATCDDAEARLAAFALAWLDGILMSLTWLANVLKATATPWLRALTHALVWHDCTCEE